MDCATLMQTLTAEGFALARPGCNTIEVKGPIARLTPELREALASHKPTLLALLAPVVDEEREAILAEAEADEESQAFPFGANTRCAIHLDPEQWEEKPDTNRPGWLRTTCRQCGAFIGYRPGVGP